MIDNLHLDINELTGIKLACDVIARGLAGMYLLSVMLCPSDPSSTAFRKPIRMLFLSSLPKMNLQIASFIGLN